MPSAEELLEENESLRSENAVLRAQIDWLRKQVFGGRKSEKLEETQMVLRLGEIEKSAQRHAERGRSSSTSGGGDGAADAGGDLCAPSGDGDDRDRPRRG